MLDVIVSQVYKNQVPPLTKSEYDALKESILEKGQLNPIVQNKNRVILDGYNRYQICLDNNIKPLFLTKQFDTKYEEEVYVVESNLKRRHLNSFQIAELGQTLHKIEKKYAKERQVSNLKNQPKSLKVEEKPEEQGKTAKKIAKKLGISTTIYEKSTKILKGDDEELKQKLRLGKVTVQKAYSGIMNQEKKDDMIKEFSKNRTKLPKPTNLHNIDFRDLKFKENSVGLIFTDPPYLREHIPLYSDLAKQAMKILRPGGALCCFVGHYAILEIIDRLRNEGLTFQWILACIHSGPSKVYCDKAIIQTWKPIILATKGPMKKTKSLKDSIVSEPPQKILHEWAQSTKESDYYIEALTEKNDIVYDPFMGSGTTGISAKNKKRQFIGCEINKVHFNTAVRMIQ